MKKGADSTGEVLQLVIGPISVTEAGQDNSLF